MGRFGHWEILVIILIAVVLFGSKRLPELGRSLGKGLSNFRSSLKEEGQVAGENEPVEKVAEAIVQEK